MSGDVKWAEFYNFDAFTSEAWLVFILEKVYDLIRILWRCRPVSTILGHNNQRINEHLFPRLNHKTLCKLNKLNRVWSGMIWVYGFMALFTWFDTRNSFSGFNIRCLSLKRLWNLIGVREISSLRQNRCQSWKIANLCHFERWILRASASTIDTMSYWQF